MNILFFMFFLIYLAGLLTLTFLFSRKMKSIEDFFLASRNLSAALVTLTLCASWFGATSTLVSVDEAFEKGLSSFWVIGMPTILTVLILGIFFSKPIRKLPIISLPDLVEMRYGKLVRNISALLILWYMIMLTASQMVALGLFLKKFLGTGYILSLAIGTTIVLLYSTFGGFRSVVLTDVFQFFLLTLGIFILLIFLFNVSDFIQTINIASSFGKKHYLNFLFDIKKNLLITLSFTLAWTISPIAWQRIHAAQDEKKAQKGMFSCAIIFLILYSTVVIIGMLSLPLFLQKTESPILSELISNKLGIGLGGFLFVALCAAIMSTMDTAINTGALTFTRDFYQRYFAFNGMRGIVTIGRISTIFVGLIAFLVATQFQSILKTLGLSSEIMAEGLFIPGVAMIFMRKYYPLAALLSLILGGGFSFVSFLTEINIIPITLPSWPFSLPYGLCLSLAGFLIGIILEKSFSLTN
ncbi:sodium:solute symporter family protein [Candidatus Aminicenantes bacterium AH-873-B07]|nr:sodium:solute symporter family protein [Candidatus Aminicenantes bacterium AH-873-B07]